MRKDAQLRADGAEVTAALYVRMSTAGQALSPQVQEACLRQYAASKAMHVVRVYLDAGHSGLTAAGRPGLAQLLADVAAGDVGFGVLLLYDVSRWGRYQDADEAGFYEFICRKAGIRLIYCAEQFANDGEPLSQLLKNIKRSMAAEYSRELSSKVFGAQRRLATLGFKQGGAATYGLRRIAVRADGSGGDVLAPGERKPFRTDHVRHGLGDSSEIAVVRRIFRLYVNDGLTIAAIARLLNAESVPCAGTAWSDYAVAGILRRGPYRGAAVYNLSTSRLATPVHRHPPEQWVRSEGALPAMVTLAEGVDADRVRQMRNGEDVPAILEALRLVYARHGSVTHALLATVPGMPGARRLLRLFGSLSHACVQAGVAMPARRPAALPAAAQTAMRNALALRACSVAQTAGAQAQLLTGFDDRLLMNGWCNVRVTIAACRRRPAGSRWCLALPRQLLNVADVCFVLAGLLDTRNEAIERYALVPVAPGGRRAVYFGSGRYAKSLPLLFGSLEQVFGLPAPAL
jgi:DNA invertase Pin-like site-specific DNA recombinase